MAEFGREIVVLSADQLVRINRLMIENTGGSFTPPTNLLNANSLFWVLETIQHPVVYQHDRYPTLFRKAALLCWTVITRHVFVDGNKRTGMAAMQVLLIVNGFFLQASDGEIEATALRIVGHREIGYTEDAFTDWVQANSIEIET